jgi:hypothetical protein
MKRHGDDATIVAAHRADELLAEGDLDGVKTVRPFRTGSGVKSISPMYFACDSPGRCK